MNYDIFNTKATATVGASAWTSLVVEASAKGWNPTGMQETVLGEEGTDQTHAHVIPAADAAGLALFLRGRYPEPEKFVNLPDLLVVLEGGEDVLIA